jgi:hypothetical protein
MNAPACDRFERTLAREDADAVWAELESHARSCPECSARLVLWKEIGEAAPSLRKQWDSPQLRARIESSLATVSGLRSGGEGDARTPGRFRWVPAAAVAALIVLSIAGVRVFRNSGGRDPLSSLGSRRAALLTDEALGEVETAEASYLTSIEKLSRLAGPRLRSATSPLAAAYREKLLLLDTEIAEMRGEIDRNRFNTHLRRELLAMYREKQRTLEELMKGES